ncbi:hypothetical protein MAP00_003770 [Monascus purpureus]|nr:hypothetical protein MAP00_003770 [Monascus purpureus]
MSEAPKPVEETPAAAPAAEAPKETPAESTPAETPAPAAETPAAEAPKEEATPETPAPATEVAAEAPKEEESKEETPVTDGVLGHKGSGLVKGLRFSKRFFYFSDEPVESKHLHVFHQNEKPAVAHPIAAWASQTGKGLLFYVKRAEDKLTPQGIFSLADITDLTKEGFNEFHFKVNGQKHTFQAATAKERDSWLATLRAKIEEAKAQKEAITSSEGFKTELEKLPLRFPPPPKAVEPKEAPKEEATPAEESKAASKSRSQSRKRTSLFGSFLGKKEETEEKKEEAKKEEAEDKEEKPAEAAATPAESAPAAETPAEAPAPAETPKEEKTPETPKEEKKPEAPATNNHKGKRTSIFGNFFQKVTSPSHEKTEKEATAPAQSSVPSTAPQLDNPVEETPAQPPADPEKETAPAEPEAPKEEAAGSPAETPAKETPAKDKRRTSFFGNLGGKKDGSDSEEHKSSKLGSLFRKPSKAVKSEKKEKKEDKETAAEAKTEPAEEPIKESPAEEASKPAESTEPVPVAATPAPVQAAA